MSAILHKHEGEFYVIPRELEIAEMLGKSWCGETSGSNDWSPYNPSLGQCAITALLIQDIFGGTLLRCEMLDCEGKYVGGHYWNKLPGGMEVDFTMDQFVHTNYYPARDTAQERTRQWVLSFPETMWRYGLLLKHFAEVRIEMEDRDE